MGISRNFTNRELFVSSKAERKVDDGISFNSHVNVRGCLDTLYKEFCRKLKEKKETLVEEVLIKELHP